MEGNCITFRKVKLQDIVVSTKSAVAMMMDWLERTPRRIAPAMASNSQSGKETTCLNNILRDNVATLDYDHRYIVRSTF